MTQIPMVVAKSTRKRDRERERLQNQPSKQSTADRTDQVLANSKSAAFVPSIFFNLHVNKPFVEDRE